MQHNDPFDSQIMEYGMNAKLRQQKFKNKLVNMQEQKPFKNGQGYDQFNHTYYLVLLTFDRIITYDLIFHQSNIGNLDRKDID